MDIQHIRNLVQKQNHRLQVEIERRGRLEDRVMVLEDLIEKLVDQQNLTLALGTNKVSLSYA